MRESRIRSVPEPSILKKTKGDNMSTKQFATSENATTVQQKTAVIYIRVNRKEKEMAEFSPDKQLDLLIGYALKNNLNVVGTYMDTASDRSQFRQMIEFLKTQSYRPENSNSCCTVIVEKIDRLYCNIEDLVTLRNIGATTCLAKDNVVMYPESKAREKLLQDLYALITEQFRKSLP